MNSVNLFFRTMIKSCGFCIDSIITDILSFRTIIRSKGGTAMDFTEVGHRIKIAREAKGLSQEDLASLVDLSPTHVSVIERGKKATRLDKFVAIANALEVSADSLLIDVVDHSVSGVSNELYEMISKLPKEQQIRILNAVRAFIGD